MTKLADKSLNINIIRIRKKKSMCFSMFNFANMNLNKKVSKNNYMKSHEGIRITLYKMHSDKQKHSIALFLLSYLTSLLLFVSDI